MRKFSLILAFIVGTASSTSAQYVDPNFSIKDLNSFVELNNCGKIFNEPPVDNIRSRVLVLNLFFVKILFIKKFDNIFLIKLGVLLKRFLLKLNP